MRKVFARTLVGAAAVLVGVAALPATAAAQEVDPVVAAPAEQRKAYEAAFDAMIEDPGNLDKTFAYAKIATTIGDYEGAVAALERMLMINPDLPRVRLELAALYYRLGSFEVARTYLTTAMESKNVPEQVRQRAAELDARIEKELSHHRFGGTLYAGLRYDTNANSGPDGRGVLVFDTPAQLDPEDTEQDDLAAFGVLNLSHVYDPKTAGGTTYETSGMLFTNRHFEQDQVDILVAEAKTGPRLRLNSRDTASATIRPYALVTYVAVHDERHYYAPGGGLEITTGGEGSAAAAFTVEGRWRRFHDSTERPNNSDQDGLELTARVQASYRVTPRTAFTAAPYYTRITAKEDWNARHEFGGSLGISQTYVGPNGTPWTTSLSGSLAVGQYDDPDITVSTTTREDLDYRATLVQSIPLTPNLAVIATGGYFYRDSNLPNYEFDNFFGTVGISFRFPTR